MIARIIKIFADCCLFVYAKIRFPFPSVVGKEETIAVIIENRCSIARFGDGELNLINRKSIGFQNGDKDLADRLKEVLNSDIPNCIIAIPSTLSTLEGLKLRPALAWVHLIGRYYKNYYTNFNFNRSYYDALISRFYLDVKDKQSSLNILVLLKSIWDKRDIVTIEGVGSKLGVGNTLFENASSLNRIIAPSVNAFSKYDLILEEALKMDKGKLFLLALGPTATVLAYDLSMRGYQACDIGHLDLEFEWLVRKSTKKVYVQGKNVNELGINDDNLNDSDSIYMTQIISRIV